MNAHTFRVLEFETIRSLLDSFAGSPAGRERIAELAPLDDPAAVRAALELTGEAVRLLKAPGRQPYHDLPDISDSLAAAQVGGLHLEPAALKDVASFIEGAAEIAGRVAAAEGAPRLARRASEVRAAREVSDAIRRAILPSGEVADDASPRLADLRRQLARLKVQLHSVMESYLHGRDADRLLQDKIVTTRNERYVLLLKADHRGQLPGVVHGASSSGASLFVEPLPAVELNNDIVAVTAEERAEVLRVLRALTAQVGRQAAELTRATAVLGELDAAQARALLAVEMNAVAPQVGAACDLDLRRARHPLLMPGLAARLGRTLRSERGPVPVNLRVSAAVRVLVVSGPNTGGKTVALKTVGLLALMAQCGLHLPVDEGSTLPVFRRVFADIGDDQSIAANLSTFSAHLANVVGMTRDLASPTLVLLDEVGAGTDPTQGGALGVAIVDHFRRAGAMVVATTHHGLMKSYAQSTAGVACAAFGFDPETYEPTYALLPGSAGRSLALEMAERLGLPAEVVSDARARLSTQEVQAEALLRRLDEEQAALLDERRRLAAERQALEEALERQRAAEHELAARKRTEVERFRQELRRRTEAASQQAADAIRAALQRLEQSRRSASAAAAQARGEAVQAIRTAEDEALSTPEVAAVVAPEAEATLQGPPAVGCRVRVKSLALAGEVLALDAHGLAEVAVAGKRLRLPVGELQVLAPAARAAGGGRAESQLRGGGGVAVSRAASAPAPAEISIVGLTVDEALPRVDKLLDEAVLGEREIVRVIHGFGQGRLRRAVAELLQGHPLVAGFHPAEARAGGAGVTVVELKG